MQRKPVILIMTSSGEIGGAAQTLAEAVRAEGTHNVVVLEESRYGVKTPGGLLDGVIAAIDEHRLLKSRGEEGEKKAERSKLKGTTRRVANAVKRYAPEIVLTVTPYAQAVFAEAKHKAGFAVPSVHIVTAFPLPKGDYVTAQANAYIVENADVKNDLSVNGVPSRHVMIMGLPYDIRKVTPIEIEAGKQELGLPKTPTVFVSSAGGRETREILGLIADQGDIVNVVCCVNDVKELPALRARADGAETASNVVLATRKDLFDEYMLMSDVVVTRYDASVIYKCFRAGKPVIAYGLTETERENIEYLVSQDLVMQAKNDIDIVALIYKLISGDLASHYGENGVKRTELYSLQNMANYLTAYISM